MGRLELSDFLLAPRWQYSEPRSGQFAPGESFVQMRWSLDSDVSGVLTIGPTSLIGSPERYGPVNANTAGLIEAYAQYNSSFGRVRMGLVPIPFGTEGGAAEGQLILPRSLLFRTRLVSLRDQGLTYNISNEGFFSDWAIHNGEGGADLDNETWFTARLGYKVREFSIGFSGQSGSTTPDSTSLKGAAEPGAVDLTTRAKYRVANFFSTYDSKKFGASLDLTSFNVTQNAAIRKYSTGHLDLFWLLGDRVHLLTRYDYLDVNDGVTGTNQEYSLGLSIFTKYENASFTILGTQIVVPGKNNNDIHQAMVIWKLTPEVAARR